MTLEGEDVFICIWCGELISDDYWNDGDICDDCLDIHANRWLYRLNPQSAKNRLESALKCNGLIRDNTLIQAYAVQYISLYKHLNIVMLMSL